ncbi:hypothetical protein PR202_gb25749 [Eleusine coracana subsp. coracana]|uniref:Uncharacterized protein n=1 Tax=Eleusine coracana subsp. coracana TaxID=191504 RepID=A0AAV5FQS8_ELECO|nr:hypothetical protein QOZ80_4BG0354860 [Eleusine coracana subsp. coracana]GJN36850.1 hypothetical protein PR202_gb25749 [Eleusine coracana subsp. coracana]
MDSAAMVLASPASDDQRFWDHLRTRVDTILEDRCVLAPPAASAVMRGVESERGKWLRDDSLMLVRGLDSVAASLAQLTDTLIAAQKEVSALATCSTQAREYEDAVDADKDEEPKAKRQCGGSTEAVDLDRNTLAAVKEEGSDIEGTADVKLQQRTGDIQASTEVAQSTNLKRARNLAVSMASRAAALARELKNIKSELHFMQERCGLLEEENKRLRDGYDNGAAPEEDDLVRLQLEALLAEKSRLAQENANLTRENQSLMQLVEYHQLTSQDLDESYEEVMQGMRLDFSSPLGRIDSGDEGGECADGVSVTPTDKLEVLSSPDQ